MSYAIYRTTEEVKEVYSGCTLDSEWELVALFDTREQAMEALTAYRCETRTIEGPIGKLKSVTEYFVPACAEPEGGEEREDYDCDTAAWARDPYRMGEFDKMVGAGEVEMADKAGIKVI